jgi:HAD superfamily hydrolase (TIGR01458 family)
MAAIKAVLLDLDGVIYIGNEPLPGAIEAAAKLREAGLALRFLTNTTRTPHRLLLAKLVGMGLTLEPDELITPATAARRMIAEQGLTPHLLVHPALAEDFAGLGDADLVTAALETSALVPGGRTAVVVGDAGDTFTYAALNRAFRALEHGAEFLALANNRSFRDTDGGLSLDAGPFVQALAFASRKEPIVLGKPAAAFFGAALASLGCTADEAVMIGDDVESDVGGALAAGLAGVLVRTGKYQPGAETRIDSRPTAVLDDLPAAVRWLLGGNLG